MEHQRDELLQRYAAVTNSRFLASQSDLDAKDHAMPDMLTWCHSQDGIVVLQNGSILSSKPHSRLVQNCKIVMRNQGLDPGPVFPASQTLIDILLENAAEKEVENAKHGKITVSAQQQRLRMLVKEAIDIGASDIHIEVRPEVARIRFRKFGELQLHAEWLPKLGREIASVAFNKETDHSVTHFNPLVPQNASMPLTIDGQEVRLRLASLPAHQGFDVVMRVLTMGDERILSLEKLGYLPHQVALIKKAINMPSGSIILAGPTGSGKTTTLASCMQEVDDGRKVYTIEDPVEKLIKGATQIPVNTEHHDRGFASMARTTLRMDPDVMVLGEMRDEDTAAVMMRAAITGHLVFSTVHTNSAMGIVTRLMDLGITTSLLASPDLLVCLICQRLVPKLCQHCAFPVTQSTQYQPYIAAWREVFGKDIHNIATRGRYCSECHGLGISGRTVIAEMIWVDEIGREFIQAGNLLGWQAHLRSQGWQSYREHLLHLVRTGQCDPLDAEKIMGPMSRMPTPDRLHGQLA